MQIFGLLAHATYATCPPLFHLLDYSLNCLVQVIQKTYYFTLLLMLYILLLLSIIIKIILKKLKTIIIIKIIFKYTLKNFQSSSLNNYLFGKCCMLHLHSPTVIKISSSKSLTQYTNLTHVSYYAVPRKTYLLLQTIITSKKKAARVQQVHVNIKSYRIQLTRSSF